MAAPPADGAPAAPVKSKVEEKIEKGISGGGAGKQAWESISAVPKQIEGGADPEAALASLKPKTEAVGEKEKPKTDDDKAKTEGDGAEIGTARQESGPPGILKKSGQTASTSAKKEVTLTGEAASSEKAVGPARTRIRQQKAPAMGENAQLSAKGMDMIRKMFKVRSCPAPSRRSSRASRRSSWTPGNCVGWPRKRTWW